MFVVDATADTSAVDLGTGSDAAGIVPLCSTLYAAKA